MRTQHNDTETEFCKSSQLMHKPISSNIMLSLVFDTVKLVERFRDSCKKIEPLQKGSLCIVRDEASGLVFTGATKAKAIGIPCLERTAYEITVMRLGKEFHGKIDKCNQTFRNCINTNDPTHRSPPPWFQKLQESRTAIRQHLPEISLHTGNVISDVQE